MMRLGVSTASFFGKKSTEDTLPLLRSLGVELCEVFLTTYSEMTPAFAKLLVERAKGIEVHSVHTLNTQFEPQLFNPIERTKNDAEQLFRAALAIGQALGAKFYTFHGNTRLKKKDNRFDYPELGRVMSWLIAIAAEYGIRVSYENVFWAYYSFPAFYRQLKPFAKGLATCLDIKQAWRSGYDYAEFIEDMADSISTVHICDCREDGSLCLPGKGIIDFAALFHRLDEVGYQGPVILEAYSGDFASEREIIESLDFLREAAGGRV